MTSILSGVGTNILAILVDSRGHLLQHLDDFQTRLRSLCVQMTRQAIDSEYDEANVRIQEKDKKQKRTSRPCLSTTSLGSPCESPHENHLVAF